MAAVIIAAGEGRRAGGYKPLWDLHGRKVIDRVIDAASGICDEIRIVGGAYFDLLEGHLRESRRDITLLQNRDWKEGGMFSSVRLGLAGLTCTTFVHPADIPGVGPGVYEVLAGARDPDHEVFRPRFEDRPGHPILLSEVAVEAALGAPADTTLRHVLSGLRRKDVPVDDPMIHFDFDTPEDFERLVAILERR